MKRHENFISRAVSPGQLQFREFHAPVLKKALNSVTAVQKIVSTIKGLNFMTVKHKFS